jgi:hypothetical protein
MRIPFLVSSELSERLETYALVPDTRPHRDRRRIQKGVSKLRLRLNSLLSSFSSEELSLRLTSANWQISETEYLLIRFWATVGGFGLGWAITRSVFPGLGLAFIGLLLPPIILNRSISQRRIKFEKQLVRLVPITGVRPGIVSCNPRRCRSGDAAPVSEDSAGAAAWLVSAEQA